MKIDNVRKLTDQNHLNLFSIQYRDTRDAPKEWVFASRSSDENPLEKKEGPPNAVVVVPYHKPEKKLVIIQEFRVVLGGYQYGFPAGLVDPGETVEQAGQRELFEETGLTLTKALRQSPSVFSSSGLTDETVSLLYGECEGAPSSVNTEASEDIRVLLLSQEEAHGLLSKERARFDVKTWIVLQAFADHGII